MIILTVQMQKLRTRQRLSRLNSRGDNVPKGIRSPKFYPSYLSGPFLIPSGPFGQFSYKSPKLSALTIECSFHLLDLAEAWLALQASQIVILFFLLSCNTDRRWVNGKYFYTP